MTTLLTWQDNKQIQIFPWDTTQLLLHRISRVEKVPLTYIQVKQDFSKLIRDISWGEDDTDIAIDVSNLANEWETADIITTMKKLENDEKVLKLFVRYKTERGEIDEQLWDTLFRYDFQDISFEDWQEQVKQMKSEEKQQEKEAHKTSRLFLELSTEEQKDIVGWKSEKHRILVQVEDLRTIEELFVGLKLEEWKLALFHQKVFEWGEKEKWIVKMKRMKDPSIGTIINEIQETRTNMETGIYLYHQDLETPVLIQNSSEKKNTYDIELESSNDIVEMILGAIGVSNVSKQTDIGMVGSFIFPQLYIDMALFQDMCMNDPVFSHFLYVNELKKATYDNVIGVNFKQDMKDILEMETIKNYDFSIKNTHRQSGFQVSVSLHTPLPEKYLSVFFLFMKQIIGRFVRKREELIAEYTKFIPQFKASLEATKKLLVKNIKATTRPEYVSKYPRMFVRNLYSVICQKNLQPILIKEEDTYNLPKESYIHFPTQPIAEINPEYYHCPNTDYPYAGLKDMNLSGKDVFINLAPCCFNSPQDKENERKLSKLRTKDDVEEEEKEKTVSKTNIISGKFIIKYPGQLGTIRPPSMNRFFMAYDPFADYFRVGVSQSPSSLIGCMMMRRNMMGVSTPYNENDVRVKISEDNDCVNACLQENPGLDAEQIRADMANPNVYFDPRRFYRAIELYFGVRVLVFFKEQEIDAEDADLLLPFSMRTHYTNHSGLPFTIVFEHWGGKTNILSKFKHPHCELVGFKTFTEFSMRFDFSPKGIFQLLDNVIYPFDGNQQIQSFYRKECWFFRHIIGQTPDPLGKVRWLHFQYYNHNFYAEIYPPLAIQDDVSVGELPDEIPIVNARLLLKFLNKFDRWEKIHIPDPDGDVVYWTVSQDNALWKSLEENSRLRLTFVCRLETPQPENIMGRDETLQDYIKTTAPDRMLFKPQQAPQNPIIHHNEKIVNILAQLCVSGFSFFLEENNVRREATDMDVLIDTFFQQKIKVDPLFLYPESIDYNKEDYKGFMSGKKIVLPSQRFKEKIMFHLRWLMFYQPQYLFDPERTRVNLFQDIADFSIADPKYYYCALNEVLNVLKYSVEDLYEITDMAIEELPKLSKKLRDLYVIWYNQKISPYPHPSIVILYKSIDKTRQAINIWRDEHRITTDAMLVETEETMEPLSVYNWDEEQKIWKKPENIDEETIPMFRAKTKDNEYLLFFPMK